MRFLMLPIACLLCCGCAWVSAGAGTLRSLEFEIAFLPLRSPKHTLMLGKSPYRGADGSIRLRCQHRVESGLPAPDGRQIRGSFRCESYFFLSGSIKMSSDLFGNLGDGAKDFSRCLCVVDQAQEVFRQSGPVIRVWLPIDVGLRRQGSADLFNPKSDLIDFWGKPLLRVLGFSHCGWLLVLAQLLAFVVVL